MAKASTQTTLYNASDTLAEIKKNSDSIELRVKQIDFDNMQIGGRNLLKNTDVLYTRTNAATATSAKSASFVDGYDLQQLIGKTVVFSYLQHTPGTRDSSLSTDTGTNKRFGMHGTVRWRDSTGAKADKTDYPFTQFLTATSTNKRVEATFTLTPPAGYDTILSFTFAIQMFSKPAADNTETWLLGYPKLEIGTKATDWTPAPEDQNAATQAVADNLAANYYTKTETAAEIKAASDGITLSVNNVKTTAESAKSSIDALKLGGRNLLRNSKGDDTTDWIYKGTIESDAEKGSCVVKSRTATTEDFLAPPRTGKVEPSTQYTFSCDIFVNEYVNSVDMFWLADTEASKKTGTTFVNATQFVVGLKPTVGKWQRITKTFTTKSDDFTGFIRIDNNGTKTAGTAAILKVANLKLEKGNRATDWTPAPEDMATGAELKVTADKIAWVVKSGSSASNFELTDRVATLLSSKFNIDALTTFKNSAANGTSTVIDGGSIITETIDASKIDVEDLFAQDINATGSITGLTFISDGEVDRSMIPSEFALFVPNSKLKADAGTVALSSGTIGTTDCLNTAHTAFGSKYNMHLYEGAYGDVEEANMYVSPFGLRLETRSPGASNFTRLFSVDWEGVYWKGSKLVTTSDLSSYSKTSHTHSDYALLSHSHSANDITTAGYLTTHPEHTSMTLIPLIHNDLAFLDKKGGAVKYYTTTSTSYTAASLQEGSLTISNSGRMFDGSPSYATLTANTTYTAVIDLSLHKVFQYSNQFYIDFGSSNWRAKNVSVYVMNSDTETSYTKKGGITGLANGNWLLKFSHTSTNSSGSTVQGFNRLRIVLSDFNNAANRRIAQIGLVNYGSAGVTETFVSRGGCSGIYGSIIPHTTNNVDLGSSSKKWKNVYATTFTGALNGNATSATKATQDGNGKVIADTYATAGHSHTWTSATPTAGTGQTITLSAHYVASCKNIGLATLRINATIKPVENLSAGAAITIANLPSGNAAIPPYRNALTVYENTSNARRWAGTINAEGQIVVRSSGALTAGTEYGIAITGVYSV